LGNDKIKGISYEEIARKGGGILNSAQRLNETSEDELYESLEYHDILKNIILKEYLKKEVVPRSTLFKMLDLVIKNENTKCKRDKHKIFELLTKNGF
jgi:hypothetical protein